MLSSYLIWRFPAHFTGFISQVSQRLGSTSFSGADVHLKTTLNQGRFAYRPEHESNFNHGSYSLTPSTWTNSSPVAFPGHYLKQCVLLFAYYALSSFQEIVQRECILYILQHYKSQMVNRNLFLTFLLVFLMGFTTYPQETCNIRDKMSECFHGG